ncbi:hypothetical protein GYB22_02310 [bacterium]|nr:hypothetical protein [bacterium]
MKKSFIKLVSVMIFVAICCSLFLPQYEVLTDGMLGDSLSFISQCPNPDQSGGLFGGGYYSTFNGFGSLNTILTVVISFLITIMLFNERLSKRLLLSLFFLMIILHVLSLLKIIIAPFGLQEPDTLKIGFYAVRLLELVLFYFAFIELKRIPKINIE